MTRTTKPRAGWTADPCVEQLPMVRSAAVATDAALRAPLATGPDWRELDDDERLPVYENLRERAATARWSADLFAKTAQEQAAERAAKRPDDKRIIIAARIAEAETERAAAFDAALAALEALAR